jgi:hypothetical protein
MEQEGGYRLDSLFLVPSLHNPAPKQVGSSRGWGGDIIGTALVIKC